MAALDLANVVRVSILSALRGLSNINTSALALITDEVPIPNDFGEFRIYLNADGVATDFGSNSETFRLAGVVFSQNPNILTGTGYLIIIPRLQTAAAQPAVITGSAPVNLTTLTATDYAINAAVSGTPAANISIGSIDTTSIATVTTSLNNAAVTAADLQFVISGSDIASAVVTLQTISTGATSAITLNDVTSGTNIAPLLNLSGAATGAAAGVERVKDTILRTSGTVPYFGIIANDIQPSATLLELASFVQTQDKLYFAPSATVGDIAGDFTTILNSGQTHTRCLYYSVSANDALDFAAAYASRGLSVNYDGALTQLTMHLKDLTNFVADPGITQTILDSAAGAGVDLYVDFGIPKVFTSGANLYFDQIYSRLALQLRLQIAGFNYLATTNTKIPQTEDGLNGLKSAYRGVMETFVGNGTYAPGAWTGPASFGDPEDLVRNIADFGYYIFSQPIAQQSQQQRNARVAPLIQIAAKESGAIHSSDVTVLIEA